MQKVNILKETSCRELWIRRLSCLMEVPISARYMLKGIDQNEDSCRIYINNEVTSDTPKGYTRPTIVTDSRLLSSLITGKLVGKIDTTGGSFKIRIFCIRKIAVHVRYRTIKGLSICRTAPFP